jgi:hypothetical protein
VGDIDAVLKDNKKFSATLKRYNNTYNKALSWNALKDEPYSLYANMTDEEKAACIKFLYKNNRLRNYNSDNIQKISAQVDSKSDPTNRFNGWNCDSFSPNNGKKVVQMFNPMSADFCLYW